MRRIILLPVCLVIGSLVNAAGAGPEGLEMKTVTPEPTGEVLFNPGMGLYLSSGRGNFRIRGDEWYLKAANILYIRTHWSTVQPEENTPLDDFFGPLFDYWVKERGMRLAFRIMSECVSTREYVTPKWVFDKGVPGVRHRGKRGTLQIDPIFWDERYLRVCERFIEQLGACLDGREGFEFIDVGSIGEWGEMHLGLHMRGRWTPAQMEETGYSETKYVQAYRRVIDAHARAFRRSQVFLNVGGRWNINDYAAIRGIHFRQDGLSPRGPSANVGKRFYHPYARRGVKCNYEFHSRYRDGPTLRAAIEKGLEDPISYLNTNAVMWVPSTADVPGELRTLLTDAARRVGYRFVLTRLEAPARIRLDGVHPGRIPMVQTWRNDGVAPCTESYALEFSLVDPAGRTVAREPFYPKTPTTHWTPGEAVEEYTSLSVPADVRPGTYTLKVAMPRRPDNVVDPTGRRPEKGRTILLGIAGRDNEDRYGLCPIECARIRPRQSLVYQAGFEADESLWKASPGITVSRDGRVGHTGRCAMRVEGTQEGAWNFASFKLPQSILPGSRYRLACWMRVAASEGRPPFMKFSPLDRGGRSLTNHNTGRYDTSAMDTWQRLSIAFETTASTAGGLLAIEKGRRTPAKIKLWLDDVTVELLEAP